MRFPLFIDLTDKKVLVIGGGKVGLSRAKKLGDFGAKVCLIDPLARPQPAMTILSRGYVPGDLEGFFLCVAATNDKEVNRQIYQEGQERGVLMNVADDPALCQFFFPALCQGNGLVAGLVSDGTEHSKTAKMAQKIRHLLEKEEEDDSKIREP